MTHKHTFSNTTGPAIVRINLFVRSIATISDIKMVSGDDATDVLVLPNYNAIVLKSHLDVQHLSTSHTHNKYIYTHTLNVPYKKANAETNSIDQWHKFN